MERDSSRFVFFFYSILVWVLYSGPFNNVDELDQDCVIYIDSINERDVACASRME